MSQWNHPICERCWAELHPDRQPVAMGSPEPEDCCYCGGPTVDGIYIREDPNMLPAHTEHDDD
jgi:hypothetical protein